MLPPPLEKTALLFPRVSKGGKIFWHRLPSLEGEDAVRRGGEPSAFVMPTPRRRGNPSMELRALSLSKGSAQIRWRASFLNHPVLEGEFLRRDVQMNRAAFRIGLPGNPFIKDLQLEGNRITWLEAEIVQIDLPFDNFTGSKA